MNTPKTLVDQFFDRVWNKIPDYNAIDEMMTEDYQITTGGKLIVGRENFKLWVMNFHKVLLEAKNENLESFWDKEEKKVVSRWRCSGINNGILGLAPDHQEVSFTGIAIWTIRDGRFSECWVERSAIELYHGITQSI